MNQRLQTFRLRKKGILILAAVSLVQVFLGGNSFANSSPSVNSTNGMACEMAMGEETGLNCEEPQPGGQQDHSTDCDACIVSHCQPKIATVDPISLPIRLPVLTAPFVSEAKTRPDSPYLEPSLRPPNV